MKLKGTLIITDPVLIAKNNDWGTVFDFDNYTIKSLEFTDYLWIPVFDSLNQNRVNTLKIHNTPENELTDIIDDYEQKYDRFLENPDDSHVERELEKIETKFTTSGCFSTESGNVGVFLFSEVIKYNNSFLVDNNEWSYSIIKDFCGHVKVYNPDGLEYSIIGTGNNAFFTI